MAKKILNKKVATKPTIVKTSAGKKKVAEKKRIRIRLEPERTNFVRSLMITELWKGEEMTELELRIAVRRLTPKSYHQFFDNYFDFVFSKLKNENLIDEILVKQIRKLRLIERLGI